VQQLRTFLDAWWSPCRTAAPPASAPAPARRRLCNTEQCSPLSVTPRASDWTPSACVGASLPEGLLAFFASVLLCGCSCSWETAASGRRRPAAANRLALLSAP